MRFFGLEITRRKAAAAPAGSQAVDDSRGWFSLWNWSSQGDRDTGSWQRDERMSDDSILAQATVFACITLAAGDIAKMALRIVQRYGKVWLEKTVDGLTDLLETPNHFQTRQQFVESWILSKLSRGNTYVLKVRKRLRDRPTALIVLNPDLCTPLVAPNGDVFYRLGRDNLAGLSVEDDLVVPASEIIHDRFNCLFHPLVGLPPIFASGLAATQSLRIQQNSAVFFKNMARPGGMLTAPAKISDETAARLKKTFEENFEGKNLGRLFVAGDSLSYSALSVNAVDSQVVEQLEWSAKTVAATFHIPPYMVGAGEPPALNNIEAEQQRYYSQCLQGLIGAVEACLDAGLELKKPVTLPDGNTATLATDFNVNDLLRMDSERQMSVLEKGVKGILEIDEARAQLNLPPTKGGNAVYMQQQNYSLDALSRRDAGEDPFGTAKPPPPAPAPAPAPAADQGAAKALADAALQQIEEAGRSLVAEVKGAAASELGAAIGAATKSIDEQIARSDEIAQILTAAGNGAAEQLKHQGDAAGSAIGEAASAARASASEAAGSVAAAGRDAADQVRAAAAAAQNSIAEAAAAAAKALATEAQGLLEPVLAELRQAAAAKAAAADDDQELEDLAARITLALETSDA